MRTIERMCAAVLLLVVTAGAYGQAIEPIVPVRPMNTALFVPSEGGSGWLVDILPSGLVFAAHYTYGPDNQPAWLILQSNFQANSEADRLVTGILGRATSQLFEGRNGPCFGCPYVAPQIVPSTYGSGELVWFDTRRAEFRWNGQVKQLSRLGDIEGASSGVAMFKGRWRAAEIVRNGSTATEQDQGFATFRERTLDRVHFRDGRPAWDPKIPLPPDNSPQFELVCTPVAGLGGACSFLRRTPDSEGRVADPVFYQDHTGDIHALSYCSDTGFPDCGVADSVNGQSIIRATFRAARFDVLIQSRDVMVIRSSFSNGGTDLRFNREYVLRRALDGVQ